MMNNKRKNSQYCQKGENVPYFHESDEKRETIYLICHRLALGQLQFVALSNVQHVYAHIP